MPTGVLCRGLGLCGCQEWGASWQRALGPPGCQRGHVSLSFATGDGDGPSGCRLPTRQEDGCLPGRLAAAGTSRGEVGGYESVPGLT